MVILQTLQHFLCYPVTKADSVPYLYGVAAEIIPSIISITR